MPTQLTLSNPTALSRSGSTDGWSNLANSIGSDDSYASSGPYSPGDKSELIRYDITVPAPLASLPAFLTLYVEAQVDPDGGTETWIIDDLVQLGTGTTPAGTNVGTSMPLPVTDDIRSYDVPTDGITLAQLNAGTAKLFLGWKASPTDASVYDPANWATAYSASGTIDTVNPNSSFAFPNTNNTSWNVGYQSVCAADIVGTLTYVGAGTAPAYVVSETYSKVRSTTFGAAPPSASLVVSNGLGATDSDGGLPIPLDALAETTLEERLSLVGSVATRSVSIAWDVDGVTGAPLEAVLFTLAVADPTPTTLKVDNVRLYAPDGGSPAPLRYRFGDMGRRPDPTVRSM